jgi:hypothetical protein
LSRDPRSIALREFGPQNIIYHNGRKYRVCQLVVQDAESALTEARISTKAGYFFTVDQKDWRFVHSLAVEPRGQCQQRLTCII